MNSRIKEFAEQAWDATAVSPDFGHPVSFAEKFAELIVRECRTVINDVYHKTPLELCGPLLTVDEEIMNHFYGVDLK